MNAFPEYLTVSSNYYRRGWSMKFHRRLKNVIMTMDWIPSVDLLEMTGVSGSETARTLLNEEQERHLQQAFDMFDENQSQTITIGQLQSVLTTMGMEVESEEETISMLPQGASNKEVSFEVVKAIVQSGAVERIQRGRYMAIVSLAEAETVRGIIHMFPGKSVVEGSSASLALRVNSHGGSGVPTLLDASHGYESPKPFQASTARQCFRFLDSDSYYQKGELNALLRAVQNNTCDERETFFLDVRSCRRRQQTSTATTPISKLFTTPDQYHLLQYRATCMRIRELLRMKNIFAMDAFRYVPSCCFLFFVFVFVFGFFFQIGCIFSPFPLFSLIFIQTIISFSALLSI